VREPRRRDTVFAPAVYRRNGHSGEPVNGGCASQISDNLSGDGFFSHIVHAPNYAIIAKYTQGGFSDSRNCDSRKRSLYGRMAFEEINTWLSAKHGRQAAVAREIGLDQDKLNKSVKGRRDWTAEEVDAIRRLMVADMGKSLTEVRAVPLLGEVPAGNMREAIRNAKGSVPVTGPSIPPRAYALIVSGDSMDLEAPDGSTIVLDPDDLDLFPGKFYVVLNEEGETTFKQYREDPARLVPCSSNDAHKPIIVGRQQFTILARVFKVIKDI
jgi:repressor LexA